MKKNVIFIGFMGAGKTSVGQAFAKRFSMSFLDTDEYIEEKAGMSVTDIFKTRGEAGFREMETEAVRGLIGECLGSVISVGGGLPLKEENRKLLKRLGTVIYLKVSPETVEKRLAGDNTRPLLQGENPGKKIQELLALREPMYENAAHFTIDVNGRNLGEIVEEAGKKAEII